MTQGLNFGDLCRAKCTAPARYLQDGRCLYISSQHNDLGIDWAVPASGGEEGFPLPSDRELDAWRLGWACGSLNQWDNEQDSHQAAE